MKKTRMRPFNHALREWLNDHGYTSGDWPNNVSPSIRREADLEVGGGWVLDENGDPTATPAAEALQ